MELLPQAQGAVSNEKEKRRRVIHRRFITCSSLFQIPIFRPVCEVIDPATHETAQMLGYDLCARSIIERKNGQIS